MAAAAVSTMPSMLGSLGGGSAIGTLGSSASPTFNLSGAEIPRANTNGPIDPSTIDFSNILAKYKPKTQDTITFPSNDASTTSPSPGKAKSVSFATPDSSAPPSSAVATRVPKGILKNGVGGTSHSTSGTVPPTSEAYSKAPTDVAQSSVPGTRESAVAAARAKLRESKTMSKAEKSAVDRELAKARSTIDFGSQFRKAVGWRDKETRLGDTITRLSKMATNDTASNYILSQMRDVWNAAEAQTEMPSILSNAQTVDESLVDADTLRLTKRAKAQLMQHTGKLKKLDKHFGGAFSKQIADTITSHFGKGDTIQTAQSGPPTTKSEDRSRGLGGQTQSTLARPVRQELYRLAEQSGTDKGEGLRAFIKGLPESERKEAQRYAWSKMKAASTKVSTSGGTVPSTDAKTTTVDATSDGAKKAVAEYNRRQAEKSDVSTPSGTGKIHDLPEGKEELMKYLTSLDPSEKPNAIAQLKARNLKRQAASTTGGSTTPGQSVDTARIQSEIASRFTGKEGEGKQLSEYFHTLSKPEEKTAREYLQRLVKQRKEAASTGSILAKSTAASTVPSASLGSAVSTFNMNETRAKLSNIAKTFEAQRAGKPPPTLTDEQYKEVERLKKDPKALQNTISQMVLETARDVEASLVQQLWAKEGMKPEDDIENEWGKLSQHIEYDAQGGLKKVRLESYVSTSRLLPEVPELWKHMGTGTGGPGIASASRDNSWWHSGLSSLGSAIGVK